MKCHEVQPLLGAYLDGELDLLHSLDIERHLADCAQCSRSLEKLRHLGMAITAAPRYHASTQLRLRLRRRFSTLSGARVRRRGERKRRAHPRH